MLVQAAYCCLAKEQPFALLMFTTHALSLAGCCREHRHPASQLPALASAQGAGFHSYMKKKLLDLSILHVQASPLLHPSRGHLGCCWCWSQKPACVFFSFYLSSVHPQPYHFKWAGLLIDVRGEILDMKALLYLVSFVAAGASLSTDGVYLSCAKSMYWRN